MATLMSPQNMDNDPLAKFLDGSKVDPFCPVDNFFATYMNTLDAEAAPPGQRPVAPPGAVEPGQSAAPPALWAAATGVAATGAAATAAPSNVPDLIPPFPSGDATGAPAVSTTEMSGGSPVSRGKKPATGSRFKTDRANKLNKAAQQRYREKKKARQEGLRQEAEVLRRRVAELSHVLSERQDLQAKLVEAERQVAHLTSAAEPAALAAAAQGASAGSGTEQAHFLDAAPPVQVLENVKQEYGRCVDTIRGILQDLGCLQAQVPVLDVTSVSAADADRVRSAVHLAYATCLEVSRLSPVSDIYGLLYATYSERASFFDGSVEHWVALVRSLGLAPEQKAQALAMRDRYLVKLEAIFEERDRLNQLGVRACLPPTDSLSRSDAARATITSKLFSFFSRGSSGFETGEVIRKLRQNLLDEQSALAETDRAIFAELLHPLQTARCMVGSFPYHCDVLSLLNALSVAAEA